MVRCNMIGDKKCPECGRPASWDYATGCYHCEQCGIDFDENQVFAPRRSWGEETGEVF